ncbi:hypothetical protein K440DRAFT_639597 [Wilcoxina mikolae CBS 423.85]|nr:hypothetical protein K440DRAFT_639597 [Wilcoxina mikolae CBS 423.85]
MALPSTPSRSSTSLVSRLSPSAVAALPSAYVSLVRGLVFPGTPSESPETPPEETFFDSTSPPSDSGTPPPNYTTAPPTPQPSYSLPLTSPTTTLLSRVVAASPCTSCSHLQLQLHLLSLQNEAYQAQRDYLLRHQPMPEVNKEEDEAGLLGFVIATFIKAVFLVAWVLWPYVRVMLGRVREWEREWEVAGRVSTWGWRMVGMTWGVVMTSGREGVGRKGVGGGKGWEVVARRGLEEVVMGVTEGVRDGLRVWGVKLE